MKIVLTLCGVVLGGMLSMSVARAEVAPGAPTILVPISQAHTSSVKPVIAGVTQTGTQVDVYVDQQFNGRATVQASATEAAAWSYATFLNLAQGWHTVTVKAQNMAGVRSAVSAPVYIYIDLLVPAPTLLTPVVNADTTTAQPWIVGLSKGGMTVEVWIDGRLNGQVEVGGTRVQTQSFKYQPFLPLSIGTHLVNVIAKDSFGGISKPTTQRVTVYAATQAAQSLTEGEATVSTLPTETAQPTSEPAAAGITAEAQTEPATQPTTESVDNQTTQSDTNAAVTFENVNTVDSEAPTPSKRENVLTTIGWVLLALVAIGMITRGRSRQAVTDDQLVKIDTSDSKPHVEVIRKPVDGSSATPPVPPALPPTQPPAPPLV